MSKRDIIIGVVVLLVLAGSVLYFRRQKKGPELPIIPPPSVEDKIEKSFNIELPEDVDKATLKDVSGGDSSGIATRKYANGKFTHTALADLPDPEVGEFYEGWLVRGNPGEANFSFISTGKMRVAKGGWLLEFQSSRDLTDYKMVVVTLEKINDKKPEKHILEGSF